MNKNRLIRHILFIAFAASLLITYVILYLVSKNDSGVYNWTLSNNKEFYERDIEFNTDYLIGALLSLFLLFYSIYDYIQDKNNKSNKQGFMVIITIMPLLMSLYSLSVFFKELVKSVVKEYDFSYKGYQMYLYLGIAAMILFFAGLFYVLENRKKNN